jgi:carbohydrate-binding DOMON domain-containing protein
LIPEQDWELANLAASPYGAEAAIDEAILDVTDPSGDDKGPGNYAYPTAGDVHAGAFDITAFQVYDDSAGSGNIIFRLQTRDLSPTFGSPLGVQLVDVVIP